MLSISHNPSVSNPNNWQARPEQQCIGDYVDLAGNNAHREKLRAEAIERFELFLDEYLSADTRVAREGVLLAFDDDAYPTLLDQARRLGELAGQ